MRSGYVCVIACVIGAYLNPHGLFLPLNRGSLAARTAPVRVHVACSSASIAMSASSEPPPHDPGFDYTLPECAAAAAKALTRPGGWTQLSGRAKECYQRLLTLVSFMHMADGHNSAKVWHLVSDYVARVQQHENAEAAQRKVENS